MFVLVLAVGGLGAPVLGQDQDASDAEDWARLPEVRVGDYWQYELSGRDRGTITNEVAGQGEKTNERFEATAQTFRIHSSGVVYSDQAAGGAPVQQPQSGLEGLVETEHEIDADKWVRLDDHATHQMEGKVVIEGSVDADVVEAFDPAFVQSFYPYTDGFKWVSTAQFYLKRGGEDPQEGEARLNAHVTAIQEVEVPAGTFRSWRIGIDIEYEGERVTSNVVRWWSQEACGLVKEERYDPSGELVNRMELTDWECSGEHVEEPDYSDRGVRLIDTAGKQPPWLDEPLETDGEPGGAGEVTAVALPGGPVVWIAAGVMAGVSVALFILGRRGS